MLEGTRMRTYAYILCMIVYCRTKKVKKFSIANMMTSDWGRVRPASEWTFGSAGSKTKVEDER